MNAKTADEKHILVFEIFLMFENIQVIGIHYTEIDKLRWDCMNWNYTDLCVLLNSCVFLNKLLSISEP